MNDDPLGAGVRRAIGVYKRDLGKAGILIAPAVAIRSEGDRVQLARIEIVEGDDASPVRPIELIDASRIDHTAKGLSRVGSFDVGATIALGIVAADGFPAHPDGQRLPVVEVDKHAVALFVGVTRHIRPAGAAEWTEIVVRDPVYGGARQTLARDHVAVAAGRAVVGAHTRALGAGVFGRARHAIVASPVFGT